VNVPIEVCRATCFFGAVIWLCIAIVVLVSGDDLPPILQIIGCLYVAGALTYWGSTCAGSKR